MSNIRNFVWRGRFLLLAPLILAVMLPCAAMAQDSDEEELSGILNIKWVDPLPGSDVEPRVEYTVTDDQGADTELQLDEQDAKSAGDLLALNRKRVEVQGEGTAGDQVEVREIEPVRNDAAREQRIITGSRPTVTILCRFSNSTAVTPHPRSWFETLMGSSKPGLDHYWREVSFNKMNLAGSQVAPGTDSAGWYNLPQPRSYYMDGSDMRDDRLVQDCTAAANAQVDFTDFTNINLMFNGDPAEYALGGTETLNLDGQTRTYGVTWNPRFSYEYTPGQGYDTGHTFLAHEMGHSFDLPHSSGPYGDTYDSDWDVMSDGGNCSSPHPEYGCLGNHTIAVHKDRDGWIEASQKYSATSASNQNITIERLGSPASPSSYLMAKIPIGGSSTVFYTLEARRFVGYDDQSPREGIVIHKVDTTNAPGLTPIATVVDTDNNGNPNDAGSAWIPGETFTDSANGISVRVTGSTSTGYNVTISGGGSPAAPANDNFANAQQLTGTSATVNGTSSGATKESGEPDHADNAGGKSVWYRWTPQESGTVTVNTNGSGFDTLLGAYTGSAVGGLSLVDEDDDGGNGSQSLVSFQATAGTTYRIAVDGFNGASGNVTLNLSQQGGSGGDTTPPTVTSVNPPENGKANRDVTITADFSEQMNPDSIDGSTIKLVNTKTGATQSATVTPGSDGESVTIDPTVAKLDKKTTYQVTIEGAGDSDNLAVEDEAGNGLAQDKVWTFKTGRK